MEYKGWVGYKILQDKNGYIAKVHSYLKQCIAQSIINKICDTFQLMSVEVSLKIIQIFCQVNIMENTVFKYEWT